MTLPITCRQSLCKIVFIILTTINKVLSMLKIMAVNAITQYIEENLEVSPINIDTLVEYSGYSRRYLQILFKK